MQTSTDRERLMALEVNQKHQDGKIVDVVERLDSLDDKVGRILEAMEKHSGFFHGIIFSFSIIGALIGAFSDKLWKMFNTH